jgi:hypothetical protein
MGEMEGEGWEREGKEEGSGEGGDKDNMERRREGLE